MPTRRPYGEGKIPPQNPADHKTPLHPSSPPHLTSPRRSISHRIKSSNRGTEDYLVQGLGQGAEEESYTWVECTPTINNGGYQPMRMPRWDGSIVRNERSADPVFSRWKVPCFCPGHWISATTPGLSASQTLEVIFAFSKRLGHASTSCPHWSARSARAANGGTQRFVILVPCSNRLSCASRHLSHDFVSAVYWRST
jgi:hypothetical protein